MTKVVNGGLKLMYFNTAPTSAKLYSKTCLKQPLKNRQNKGLNGSLMKVKSIAECSKGSILQYFDLH